METSEVCHFQEIIIDPSRLWLMCLLAFHIIMILSHVNNIRC